MNTKTSNPRIAHMKMRIKHIEAMITNIVDIDFKKSMQQQLKQLKKELRDEEEWKK